jgi:hypothetical protein
MLAASVCLSVLVGAGDAGAASARARVVVNGAGLYKVTAADLATALHVSPATVRATIKQTGYRVSRGGSAVAYLRATDGSAIFFYGRALDTIYTGKNVYWVERGKGRLVKSVTNPATRRSVRTASRDSADSAEHLIDAPGYFHDPEADFWLWDVLQADAPGYDDKTYDLVTPDVAAGAASLTVRVHGLSSTDVDKEHHLRLSLNGSVLGDGRWTGGNGSSFTFAVPLGVLRSGGNQARLQAVRDAGVPYSVWALRSFSVSYLRKCMAVRDQLTVRATSTAPVRVSRLSHRNAWVLDVSTPDTPRRVRGTKTGGWNGAAWVRFSARQGKRYLVATRARAMRAKPVAAAAEPGLKAPGRGAEYVVITAPALRAAAEELADYRAESGMSTTVVTTQDVYDDFSHGVVTPHAITDFVAYARSNWSPRPRYIALAGDGSYDYRDYLGHGDCLVPPVLVDASSGVTASDVALITANAKAVPEVAVGRIPVTTSESLSAYVDKLRRYETATGEWRSRTVLVADKPGDGGDFTADSDEIAALLPASFTVTRMYQGSLGFSTTRTRLLAALSEGSLLMDYVGHGGFRQLGSDPSSGLGLLQVEDVESLASSDRLPVFAMLTCAAGQFAVPGAAGIAEALVVEPDAGAIAVLAPTAWEFDHESMILGKAFTEALGATRAPLVGEAFLGALAVAGTRGGSPETRLTYTLLGDPGLIVTW